MNNEYLNLEIKTIEETGKISGYGSIFNNVDLTYDVVEKGAFTKTLLEKNIKDIYFLRQHDTGVIIGEFTKIQEDENGLYIEANLFLDTTVGKDAYKLAKKGILNSFSIGYIPTEYEFIEKDDKEIRVLKEINLKEISLVILPANQMAKVLSVKSEINNIQIDNKEEEIKDFYDNEDFKMDGFQIFNVKNDIAKLNFKAVEDLPSDVKQKNKEKIQQYYRMFRKEFKDYTLMSEVCELKELINIWELKEFDKFLKSEHKGLTNTELKLFYTRIVELKNFKKDNDDVKARHLPLNENLVDSLLY